MTEGEAHFALIVGEPGIGKSRLAEMLLDSCSRDSKCRSSAWPVLLRTRSHYLEGWINWEAAKPPCTRFFKSPTPSFFNLESFSRMNTSISGALDRDSVPVPLNHCQTDVVAKRTTVREVL